jgi:hypothetical protein
MGDDPDSMDGREFESFALSRAEFEALRIIESETQLPIDVQLMQAHLLWVHSNQERVN